MTLGYCQPHDPIVMFWVPRKTPATPPKASMKQKIRHVEDGMRWLQHHDDKAIWSALQRIDA